MILLSCKNHNALMVLWPYRTHRWTIKSFCAFCELHWNALSFCLLYKLKPKCTQQKVILNNCQLLCHFDRAIELIAFEYWNNKALNPLCSKNAKDISNHHYSQRFTLTAILNKWIFNRSNHRCITHTKYQILSEISHSSVQELLVLQWKIKLKFFSEFWRF